MGEQCTQSRTELTRGGEERRRQLNGSCDTGTLVHSVSFRSIARRYVDAYRSVAVQLGATSDLKNVISKSGESEDGKGCMSPRPSSSSPFPPPLPLKGMKTSFLPAPGTGPGEPNDEMYLKQAEHLMKRSIYPSAVAYLDQAINLNPHSKVGTDCTRHMYHAIVATVLLSPPPARAPSPRAPAAS